jgi:RNA polymerase-binding transcription factor DksA
MNYRQAYVNLITKAKQRSAENLDPRQKYEWHHYFPVCFWRDKKANSKKVPLTLREHWVAHRLLFKMFPSPGTAAALICMAKRDPAMNSRKFEAIRKKVSDHNWTKSEKGRIFLSQEMKRRWEAGVYSKENAKQARSERGKALQVRWKKDGNHPLSSDTARQRSSERAKARNKEMNAKLNKEKGKIVRICEKCGAQIRGPMGNMKQHQRGSKCSPQNEN